MKSTAFLSALAAAAVGLVASEELKIDVTHKVACERKTKNGDKVSMHYRGTLGGSGKKFDASMLAAGSSPLDSLVFFFSPPGKQGGRRTSTRDCRR